MRIKIIKASSDSLWYSEKHENCIGKEYVVLNSGTNKYGLYYIVKHSGIFSYTVEVEDCILVN